MDIVAAFEQVGPMRGGPLCGTTHKTLKRVIEHRRAGEPFDAPRREVPKNTDAVAAVIADKVRATDGRISAKRLLPLAKAAGYTGSARKRPPPFLPTAWSRSERSCGRCPRCALRCAGERPERSTARHRALRLRPLLGAHRARGSLGRGSLRRGRDPHPPGR